MQAFGMLLVRRIELPFLRTTHVDKLMLPIRRIEPPFLRTTHVDKLMLPIRRIEPPFLRTTHVDKPCLEQSSAHAQHCCITESVAGRKIALAISTP
jgi:hypothetical protein